MSKGSNRKEQIVKIKMPANQPIVADICLHYVCAVHTVITLDKLRFETNSLGFQELTHPFNSTTVNCSDQCAK